MLKKILTLGFIFTTAMAARAQGRIVIPIATENMGAVMGSLYFGFLLPAGLEEKDVTGCALNYQLKYGDKSYDVSVSQDCRFMENWVSSLEPPEPLNTHEVGMFVSDVLAPIADGIIFDAATNTNLHFPLSGGEGYSVDDIEFFYQHLVKAEAVLFAVDGAVAGDGRQINASPDTTKAKITSVPKTAPPARKTSTTYLRSGWPQDVPGTRLEFYLQKDGSSTRQHIQRTVLKKGRGESIPVKVQSGPGVYTVVIEVFRPSSLPLEPGKKTTDFSKETFRHVVE